MTVKDGLFASQVRSFCE